MSGAVRLWVRQERDRLARLALEQQGYVLDYWLVYRVDFAVRLSSTLLPPARRPTYLRNAARGSSRRLHEERLARLRA